MSRNHVTQFGRAALLGPFLMAVACQLHPPQARPSHAEGRFVRFPSEFAWIHVSDDEIGRFAPPPYAPQAAHLPAAHPAAVALSGWLAEFHAAIVRKNPQAAAIPIPRVVINSSAEFNAMNVAGYRCYRTQVRLSNAADVQDVPVIAYTRGGLTARKESFLSRCVWEDLTAQSLAALQALLSSVDPRCVPTLGEAGLSLSPQCPGAPELAAARGGSFAVASTPDIISVNAGLILNSASENDIVGTLAHELGHYYRPAILPVEHVAFLRSENSPTENIVPTENQDAIDLAIRLETLPLEQIVEIPEMALSVFNQTLSISLLSKFSVDELGTGGDGLPEACRVFWTQDFRTSWGSAVRVVRNARARDVEESLAVAALRTTGQTLANCAPHFSLNGSDSIRKTVTEFLAQTSQALGMDIAPEGESETLEPLLQAFADVEHRYLSRTDALVAQASAMGLSWHSEEDLADDVALELLAAVHLPVAAAMSDSLILLSQSGNRISKIRRMLDRTNGKCLEYRNNGWRDPVNDQPIFPFIGTIRDAHHGDCYRLFRGDEQIAAHRYPAGTRQATAIGDFEAFQNEIRAWLTQTH